MPYISNNYALYPEWLCNRIETQGAIVAAAVLEVESTNTTTSDPTNSALFTTYQTAILEQIASFTNQTGNNAFTFLGLNFFRLTPKIFLNDVVAARNTFVQLAAKATATG